jgi:phosphoketolase
MDEIDRLFLKSTLLHTKWCEVWLPIRRYPNYEISSKGKVQNIKTKKMLKPYTDRYGYDIIILNNNNRKKKAKIHRLVATN